MCDSPVCIGRTVHISEAPKLPDSVMIRGEGKRGMDVWKETEMG